MSVLGDRWEWVEITRLCDDKPVFVRGRCLHRDVVPVETVGALEPVTVVACLCLTCDTQLPADWLERNGCEDCTWTWDTGVGGRRVDQPCRRHRP